MVNTIKGNGLQGQLANLKHFLKTNYNKKEPQEALDHHRLRAFTDILVTALEGIYPDHIKFDKSEGALHLLVVDDLFPGERPSGSKVALQLIFLEYADGPLFMGFEKFTSLDDAIKSSKHALRTLKRMPEPYAKAHRVMSELIAEIRKQRMDAGSQLNKNPEP